MTPAGRGAIPPAARGTSVSDTTGMCPPSPDAVCLPLALAADAGDLEGLERRVVGLQPDDRGPDPSR